MDIDKEKKEILFDLFKNQLISFLEEEFNDCKDNKELRNILKKYRDDIYEKLGGEIFDNQKDDIERLECKIGDLENVIDDLKDDINRINGKSLDDEYKIGFYLEYKDKYTPWELEELLKDGKNSQLKELKDEIDELIYDNNKLKEENYELKDKLNEL